ncbi:hypothetical protein M1439_02895 [Candidatus Marsarchaeota archaeon]|jgi:hypothetical protein|nr:hypothetical protein [Candidatus Marsarchaeota archaeon]MCL5092625.1 hypothetical protein [Candidatus Marsarchaeota archaeon]
MSDLSVSAKFIPEKLKAYAKNDVTMVISLNNASKTNHYWCECDVNVKSPLSLAHDRELDTGRTRMGIAHPESKIEKHIKVYTRPNNFPDDYTIKITAYVYDQDGAISERIELPVKIECADEPK